MFFQVTLPLEFEQPVNGMVSGSPSGCSQRDPHFLHQSSQDPMATSLHVNSPGGPVLTSYGMMIMEPQYTLLCFLCHTFIFTLVLYFGNTKPKIAQPILFLFLKLIATGRYQLMSGVRRLDLKYEGDPDLKPICTYEIPFLVRWLYSLSLIINSKVCEGYSGDDGTGDWVVVFVVVTSLGIWMDVSVFI